MKLLSAYSSAMTGHDLLTRLTFVPLNISSPKDGNSKDFYHFHDVVIKQLCALKALMQNSLKSFVSLVLKLKFDQVMSGEWQRYSREHKGIPLYINLLEFMDL